MFILYATNLTHCNILYLRYKYLIRLNILHGMHFKKSVFAHWVIGSVLTVSFMIHTKSRLLCTGITVLITLQTILIGLDWSTSPGEDGHLRKLYVCFPADSYNYRAASPRLFLCKQPWHLSRGALGNAARRFFCSRLISSAIPPFTSWMFQASTCSLVLSHSRCKELCHRFKKGFGTGQRCCCMFFPGWTNQQQWKGWTGLSAKEERCQTQSSCRVYIWTLTKPQMLLLQCSRESFSRESFSWTFALQQITALWLNLERTKHQVNNNPWRTVKCFPNDYSEKICIKQD